MYSDTILFRIDSAGRRREAESGLDHQLSGPYRQERPHRA